MGSWDCYCAICGGPFVGVVVSQKPLKPQDGAPSPSSRARRPDDESSDSDEEPMWAEDDGAVYDRGVITEEEVQWCRSLHALGFNPNATGAGVRKSFVTGPGTYGDYGGVDVVEGIDPNVPSDAHFSCYQNWTQDDEPVFPFHRPCWQLLAKALAERHAGNLINPNAPSEQLPDMTRWTDRIYSVMLEHGEGNSCALNLDYGDPAPGQEQFWQSSPGTEIFVANPHPASPEFKDMVIGVIYSIDFSPQHHPDDALGAKVVTDPFAKLPYDVQHRIFDWLGNGEDIFGLAKASWFVHASLHRTQFWTHQLRARMPWFFELHELLGQDDFLADKDPKRVFLWALAATKPRLGIEQQPFLSLANRRRVWRVCEQLVELILLAEKHDKEAAGSDDDEVTFVEKCIQDSASCTHMPIVSSPSPSKTELVSTFWLRDWGALACKKKVTTFFDAEGSLTGIQLSILDSATVHLFGESNGAASEYSDVLPVESGNWITGIILHVSRPDLRDVWRAGIHGYGRPGDPPQRERLGNVASVKGITYIPVHGDKITHGTTTSALSQRPLIQSSAPNNRVVGLQGVTGRNAKGQLQILRLGLLEAKRPFPDDYSLLPSPREPAEIPLLQQYMWKYDYASLLGGKPIWLRHDDMRVVTTSAGGRGYSGLSYDVKDDLIPYEALVWATDLADLGKLKCLTAYTRWGGTMCGMGEDKKPFKRDYLDVAGVRAEYADGREARTIGIEREPDGDEGWRDEHCERWEIDGPGGERVTEVKYALHERPKAIEIRTNRGRARYWGEENVSNWQTLFAPEGETLVGLLVTFSAPGGKGIGDLPYDHLIMTSVAALSIRLGSEFNLYNV